jgi:predicted ABC-type ATPase
MATDRPSVIILAGPNGAGKSTAAPALLRQTLGIVEFVNADTIAQGLAAFDPAGVAVEASAILLARLQKLGDEGRSFAFETTLASRSLAPRLRQWTARGYDFHLLFLWLPSADMAVARVADRVRMGGHDVPEGTVRRRYDRGLRNFFSLYRPLASQWSFYDNSDISGMRLIATGDAATATSVSDPATWVGLQQEYSHAKREC